MEIRFSLSTTNLLISINILLFIFAQFLSVIIGGPFATLEALDLLGADNFIAVRDGEIWRLITSTFLHANFLHLAFNMYALFIFGGYFENRYGGKKLFILYIFSGIAGSLASLLWEGMRVYLLDINTINIGVGASGALFGILGFLLLSRDYYLDKSRLYILLALNLMIGFMFPNIDNMAHLGGLFSGMLLAFFGDRMGVNLDRPIYYKFSLLLFGLSFIALFISITFKIFA